MKTLVAFLVVAILALGAIDLSGNSSTSSASTTTHPKVVILDTSKVARAIETSIRLQRDGLRSTVTCPRGVPQVAGRSFTCTAVTKHARTPFLATVQNPVTGYTTYVGR
jgi:hypothetical protein